jgi:hypothetical protein
MPDEQKTQVRLEIAVIRASKKIVADLAPKE